MPPAKAGVKRARNESAPGHSGSRDTLPAKQKRMSEPRKSAPEENEAEAHDFVDDDGAGSDAGSDAGNAPPASVAGGFAAAMSKVLARSVTKTNPVLAKRHTAAEKIVAKEKAETKVSRLKTREKKAARRAHMQLPDVTKQDYERQLKKVATKGVVSLFNTINKHQKSVAAAAASEVARVKEVRETREAERLRPNPTQHSFLDLLHQNVNKPANAGAQDATTGSAPSGVPGSKWAVLSDGYLSSKQAAEAATAGDDGDDAPDILDSDSD